FYGVLLLAGGQDVIADKLGLPITGVTTSFRILVFALPAVTAALTWRLCRDLQSARSAAELEEEAPLPIGPAEPPLAPATAPAPPSAEKERSAGVVKRAAQKVGSALHEAVAYAAIGWLTRGARRRDKEGRSREVRPRRTACRASGPAGGTGRPYARRPGPVLDRRGRAPFGDGPSASPRAENQRSDSSA